ncbi:methionine adenosyltransferase [Spiroplasma endosymbiont of Crioceris asparagi]|uniref:methionine adenosyltransferase n=1 Tax=Spiroplasma endosymbiont of Crioceris asparagi TaxID=3066286 RepID=UPI0030CB5E1B
MKILFTSESVSEGHPDKICDQVSDAILDECLKQDKLSRVACEVFICDQKMIIGGEITTSAKIDYDKIAREVIKKIGYEDETIGCDWRTLKIEVMVNTQSPDIALGLKNEDDLGAGDQGIMFGYATNETDSYMPLAIKLAHELAQEASRLRKSGKFKWAKPDMKTQFTIDYTNKNEIKIDTVLISVQHDKEYIEAEFKNYIKNEIISKIAKKYNLNNDYKVLINPTGQFIIGGPKGDAGLTGRKIIVDSYGGYARHGGGAFSGKDATKVDRSACYMARYAAKNLVAAGFADKLEIQISYAIGKPQPVSIFVETFGTNKVSMEKIYQAVNDNFDFSVSNIIRTLNLRTPIFSQTSTYGHFGKEELPWEKLNLVNKLKKYL